MVQGSEYSAGQFTFVTVVLYTFLLILGEQKVKYARKLLKNVELYDEDPSP